MKYLGINFDIEFNFGSLVFFISGIIFGITIFGLTYLYFTLKTLKEKKYYVESKIANEIKEEDIKEIIKYKQEKYLVQRKDPNKSIASNAAKNAIYEVINEIASKYFPESKRPLLELSIDELLMLMKYISERVETLLGHRGLRILKRVKISSIMNIVDKTIKVNNTTVVQTAKKYKFGQIIKVGSTAINFVNPVYWIKKGTSKFATKLILKKIVLIIISIAGEETYKIYSKQAFLEQDPSYIKMMREIESVLEESDSLEELDEDELNEYVDNLPNDEQNLLLNIEHNKNKKWWKRKAKEKVASK